MTAKEQYILDDNYEDYLREQAYLEEEWLYNSKQLLKTNLTTYKNNKIYGTSNIKGKGQGIVSNSIKRTQSNI
jgi:hypothetical protein